HDFAAAADRVGEERADPAQTVVAGRMSAAVVEVLEVIEVEEDQRQRRLAATRAIPFVRQRALEIAAVRDAGEIVLERQRLEPRVRLLEQLHRLLQLARLLGDALAQTLGLAAQPRRADPRDQRDDAESEKRPQRVGPARA